jgi:hypothetical protein
MSRSKQPAVARVWRGGAEHVVFEFTFKGLADWAPEDRQAKKRRCVLSVARGIRPW